MSNPLTNNPPKDSGDIAEKDGLDPFKNLVELLEFEISHIRSEESKPGWTTWALMGGLATMVWLLTHEFEQNHINAGNALFLFLICSLTYDSVRMLSSVVSKTVFWQGGRFITPSAELSPDRPFMLFTMIRSVVLLLIASKAQRFLGRTFQTLVFVFYGFRIFSVVFGFILSFTNLPVPGPPKSSKFVYVIRALGLGLGMLAAVASLNAIFNRPNFSMPEYRVGALLFGVGVIISLLATSQPKTPLLETLVGIRRSLALGQLDLDTARRQTEIALQGMTVSDALQNQLVSLLADLERGGIHLEAASKEIEAFLSTFRGRGSEASKETHTLVHMLIQSVNRHLQEVKTAFDSFTAKRNKFNNRVFAYLRISPEIQGSLSLLRRKLDDASEVFNSKRNILVQRAAEFDSMLRSEQTQARQ